MVPVAVRAKTSHELQKVFSRQRIVGLLEQQESARKGKFPLPLDPVVAVVSIQGVSLRWGGDMSGCGMCGRRRDSNGR